MGGLLASVEMPKAAKAPAAAVPFALEPLRLGLAAIGSSAPFSSSCSHMPAMRHIILTMREQTADGHHMS